ncbi:MAG: hypothetical protein M1831_000898 [Alyxoria varia]|nr:MAG: hypothetical protein M1831_000898 [Alyxoria varia]
MAFLAAVPVALELAAASGTVWTIPMLLCLGNVIKTPECNKYPLHKHDKEKKKAQDRKKKGQNRPQPPKDPSGEPPLSEKDKQDIDSWINELDVQARVNDITWAKKNASSATTLAATVTHGTTAIELRYPPDFPDKLAHWATYYKNLTGDTADPMTIAVQLPPISPSEPAGLAIFNVYAKKEDVPSPGMIKRNLQDVDLDDLQRFAPTGDAEDYANATVVAQKIGAVAATLEEVTMA